LRSREKVKARTTEGKIEVKKNQEHEESWAIDRHGFIAKALIAARSLRKRRRTEKGGFF